MTRQERTFVQQLQSIARQSLDLRHNIQLLVAEWNQNDYFNQITNDDLVAMGFAVKIEPAQEGDDPTYEGVTASELANAITAITGIDTALGDFSSGQAVNLVKMRS